MNPLDFLIVARRLSSSAKESDARTSIGRTYYALFNHLKIKIEPIKEVPVSSEAHQALVRYLLKSNNKTLSSVGQCLNDLRKNRNDADYKMALVLDKTKSEPGRRESGQSPSTVRNDIGSHPDGLPEGAADLSKQTSTREPLARYPVIRKKKIAH